MRRRYYPLFTETLADLLSPYLKVEVPYQKSIVIWKNDDHIHIVEVIDYVEWLPRIHLNHYGYTLSIAAAKRLEYPQGYHHQQLLPVAKPTFELTCVPSELQILAQWMGHSVLDGYATFPLPVPARYQKESKVLMQKGVYVWTVAANKIIRERERISPKL